MSMALPVQTPHPVGGAPVVDVDRTQRSGRKSTWRVKGTLRRYPIVPDAGVTLSQGWFDASVQRAEGSAAPVMRTVVSAGGGPPLDTVS
jgi:hypothetical protein